MEAAVVRHHKAVQRSIGHRMRQMLSCAARKKLSAKISARIIQSGLIQGIKLMLSYIPTGAEADISAVSRYAEASGISVAYPYCINKTTMLALIPLGADSWGTDAYGIRAPKPERSLLVNPKNIELVLTPCVVFDKNCRRLGMGAGVYDRYFKACSNAKKLGAAFSLQEQHCIEFDPDWDMQLDAVITENKTYIK